MESDSYYLIQNMDLNGSEPKYETWSTETARDKHKKCPTWCRCRKRHSGSDCIHLRIKANNWQFIKLKIFCRAKETTNHVKRKPTEWERIFSSQTSDRALIYRIYKELKNTKSQKKNQDIRKWAMALIRENREFWVEEIKTAKKCLKKKPIIPRN